MAGPGWPARAGTSQAGDRRIAPAEESATTLDAQANAAVFARDAGGYADQLALQPAERALLKRFRHDWASTSMLDLGVGAGRTAYTFAALVERYVGVDYVPEMVESSRRSIGEDASTRFLVADARDLSGLNTETFDFVLFSFNGIDYVDLEDRVRILREVRKVVAPDGSFAFSSHSLLSLPFKLARPALSWRDPVRAVYKVIRALRAMPRLARANRHLKLPSARARGWQAVRDPGHDFSLVTLYVTPEFQARQLVECGFTEPEIYDSQGRVRALGEVGRDPWLYYLCRPAPPAIASPTSEA